MTSWVTEKKTHAYIHISGRSNEPLCGTTSPYVMAYAQMEEDVTCLRCKAIMVKKRKEAIAP